jgi:SOS-response transcriptional repressor LexA
MKSYRRYKQVMDFVQAYMASNQEAPTMAEIGQYVGWKSPNSVFRALAALEHLGLIQRSRKWRGIQIVK